MSGSLSSGSFHPVGIIPAIGSSFARWGRLIWQGLFDVGSAKASEELHRLAVRHESGHPVLAQELHRLAQDTHRPSRDQETRVEFRGLNPPRVAEHSKYRRSRSARR